MKGVNTSFAPQTTTNTMKKQTLAVLLFFLSARSYAVQDSISNSITYQNINILSNRLLLPFEENNRNIQILDRKTIESLCVNSVSELLSYCNGIDVRQRGQNGTQSDIGINGGTFDQTLILINGMKFIDAQTAHHIMNLPIAVSSIERIEILKGSAASRYGLNALVGAINIITKKDIKNNYTELDITSGSNFRKDTSNNNLFYNYSIGINTYFKTKKSSNILSLSNIIGSGYRYNTSINNKKMLFNSTNKISNTSTLSILSGYINNKFGANSFYASPYDKDAFEKVETFIGIIELNKIYNKLILSPKLSYRYNYDDYIFIKQKPEVYENNHFGHTYSIELNASYMFRKSIIAIGIEKRNDLLKSNNLGNRSRINNGLFLEYRTNYLDKKLSITSGLYINNNSEFGTKLFPGIDAGYSFNNSITAYANFGKGQRIPTFTDLYYTGPSNIGNSNLQPEESFSKEIGFKYNYRCMNGNIGVFNRKINKFIDWTKDNISDPWQASNFNSIYTSGINIENNFILNSENKAWHLYKIKLNYTFLNSKITSDSLSQYSRYVIENLRTQFISQLLINLFPATKFSISYKFLDRANYKNYQVVDCNFTFQIKKMKINLSMQNLFDEKFEEIAAVPIPGRWTSLGVSYKIN